MDLDGVPAPLLVIDADDVIVAANARALSLLLASGADLPSPLAAHFPQETAAGARLRNAAGTGTPVRLEARRATGVPFSADADAELRSDGSLWVVLRELEDDRLVAEAGRHFDHLFESSPIGLAVFNTDGEYVRVNPALCDLLGRDADDLVGRRDQELTHPDDRRSDVEAAWRILNGELDSWQTEKRFLRPCGATVWVIANMVFVRDWSGRPLSWVGQFQDITDRKQHERELRHLAETDELTGLANRRRIMLELDARCAMAGRYGETGAVLVIDLDAFKDVNDVHGHSAGDTLLADVSRALTGRLRRTDLLGRLGGDEFAVILPRVAGDEAVLVAIDLLEAVRGVRGEPVGASCGVALYGPDRPGAPETILANADRAMYRAKAGGGDAVHLHDSISHG